MSSKSESEPLKAGPRLSAKLVKLGITQAEAESLLHVGAGNVSRWISGARTPSLEMAFRIQASFGIPAKLWAPRAKVAA